LNKEGKLEDQRVKRLNLYDLSSYFTYLLMRKKSQSRRKRKPDPAPDGPWNLYRKEKKRRRKKETLTRHTPFDRWNLLSLLSLSVKQLRPLTSPFLLSLAGVESLFFL